MSEKDVVRFGSHYYFKLVKRRKRRDERCHLSETIPRERWLWHQDVKMKKCATAAHYCLTFSAYCGNRQSISRRSIYKDITIVMPSRQTVPQMALASSIIHIYSLRTAEKHKKRLLCEPAQLQKMLNSPGNV